MSHIQYLMEYFKLTQEQAEFFSVLEKNLNADARFIPFLREHSKHIGICGEVIMEGIAEFVRTQEALANDPT